MGQAFDPNGDVLGEAYGATKREVFEKLNEAFKDAAEIRIKSLADQRPFDAAGGASVEMPRYGCRGTSSRQCAIPASLLLETASP